MDKCCENCIYCSGELKNGVCECFSASSEKEFVRTNDSCDKFEEKDK